MRNTKEELEKAMLLYAVTDSAWLNGGSLSNCVQEAIKGGVTCVQLREKDMEHDRLVTLATEIKQVCTALRVPFIVNDAVGVADVVDAEGVHVGQDDLACSEARRILGEEKIVGVSVQTVGQAKRAQREGADYLGVGAMFATGTKPDAEVVSVNTLREICEAVSIPVIAIGGMNESTIGTLSGTGVAGVAVVSALFAAPDIKNSARSLLEKISAVVGPK